MQLQYVAATILSSEGCTKDLRISSPLKRIRSGLHALDSQHPDLMAPFYYFNLLS